MVSVPVGLRLKIPNILCTLNLPPPKGRQVQKSRRIFALNKGNAPYNPAPAHFCPKQKAKTSSWTVRSLVPSWQRCPTAAGVAGPETSSLGGAQKPTLNYQNLLLCVGSL